MNPTPSRATILGGPIKMTDRIYLDDLPRVERVKPEEYNLYPVREGLWLVGDVPNAADFVYYWKLNEKSREGYGGSALTFKLTDRRGTLTLAGPWHSNSDSLFIDTGVDVQSKCLTYVVIGESRGHDPKHYYQGILHQDSDWTLGPFNRGKLMAAQMAQELGKTVYCYSHSMGGSSDSPVHPEEA